MLNIDILIRTLKGSQKTLFILCGFPYSGKSFIAQELQKQCDFTFVSIDDVFYSHGFDWTAGKTPSEDEWGHIFKEAYEKTKEALSRNENVLFDSTNHTFARREGLRDLANSVQAESMVIFVDVSRAIVWERWRRNLQDRSRSVVNKKLVEEVIAEMEEPHPSENVIRIANE